MPWDLTYPRCSCSSSDVFPNMRKPQAGGRATGPARHVFPIPQLSWPGRMQHIQFGEGMQVPDGADAAVLLRISALLGLKLLLSRQLRGWWQPPPPLPPPCFLQRVGRVRDTAGGEGAARKGERGLWDSYFSSKSPWDLLVFSKSGRLHWEGGLGSPSWWGAWAGCRGRDGLKIWGKSGKRVSQFRCLKHFSLSIAVVCFKNVSSTYQVPSEGGPWFSG